jgi:hypothetical protein
MLWGGADEVGSSSSSSPDCSVRRPLALELAAAQAALLDAQRTRCAARHDPHSIGRRGSGWLELTDTASETPERELRLRGALHVGRCGRVVPVEVVLAPWSTSTCELRLQLRRRADLPRRYFEVAQDVIDSLRDEVQRTTGAARRALRTA